MTSIVSSIIKSDSRQADGRRWIHELHVDSNSYEHTRWYLCDAGFDAESALADYAVQLNLQLAAEEITNGNT